MLKRWRWVGDFRGFGGHVSVLIWFFFFNLKKKKKKKKPNVAVELTDDVT